MSRSWSTAYYRHVTEAIQERMHPVLIDQQSPEDALRALAEEVGYAMAGR